MSAYRAALSFVGASLLALTVVGCQSSPPATVAAPQKAVLISSGQGTTTVYVPAANGGVATLASNKVEKCPDCEKDVAEYFKSGHLAATCATCGATRTVLTGTN